MTIDDQAVAAEDGFAQFGRKRTGQLRAAAGKPIDVVATATQLGLEIAGRGDDLVGDPARAQITVEEGLPLSGARRRIVLMLPLVIAGLLAIVGAIATVQKDKNPRIAGQHRRDHRWFDGKGGHHEASADGGNGQDCRRRRVVGSAGCQLHRDGIVRIHRSGRAREGAAIDAVGTPGDADRHPDRNAGDGDGVGGHDRVDGNAGLGGECERIRRGHGGGRGHVKGGRCCADRHARCGLGTVAGGCRLA